MGEYTSKENYGSFPTAQENYTMSTEDFINASKGGHSQKTNQQEVATLVPNKPDSEIANELRERCRKAFEPLIEIQEEALRHGLIVGWGSFVFNPQTGRFIAPPVDVSRHY